MVSALNITGNSLLDDDEDRDSPLYKDKQEALTVDVRPRTRALSGFSASEPEQPKVAPAPVMVAEASPKASAGVAFDPRAYLSAAPAVSDAAPAAKVENAFNPRAYLGISSAPTETQKPASESGDTSRGFTTALEQTPALLKGAVGFAGAVGEKTFGEGGAFTALKKYGLEGYQKDMEKIGERAKETDDVTKAWDRAKQGDIGALVDWAQYGIGYLGGNVVETAATALLGSAVGSLTAGPAGTVAGGVGGAVGKEATKGFVKNLVEGMVAKEAARLAEKEGLQTATEQITKEATKSVARGIGSTAALVGSGILKETGSIYGEAVEQAGGKDLDAGDLARVFGSGVVAGMSEAVLDRLGLDAITGKIKIPGGGRVGSAFVGGAVGVGAEGGQELFQTAVERFGAAKALTGEDAINEYINAFALGGLGGGTIGAAVGAFRGGKSDKSRLDDILKAAEKDLTSDDGRQELFDSMLSDPKMAEILKANGIESGDDPRFQGVVVRAIQTQKLLADLEPLSAEEQAAKTAARQADVEAAFAAAPADQTETQTPATNSAGFVEEPVNQVQAQIDAVREGRKNAAVLGEEEAKAITADGVQSVRVLDPETGAYSVVFSNNADTLKGAQKLVNDKGFKPAMGEILEYAEPNKTSSSGEPAVVVQQTDEQTGQILKEEAVTPGNEGSVTTVPGTTATTTTVDAAIQQRIDEAANQAATSPTNDLPQPTEGQKKAGNYKKGSVKVLGLDISVENPRGSERSGTDASGKAWKVGMAHHYGYVKGSKGNDKDQVDVFIGPNPKSNKVFVVDQINPDGSFDEHKAMLGFDTIEEARAGYMANYSADWQGLGAISEMPADAFKSWVTDGTKKKPLAYVSPNTQNNDTSVQQTTEPKSAPAKEPKPAKAAKEPKAPKAPKVEKPKAADIKKEAIELWEDNDDGEAAHIPFNQLSKEAQADWVAAFAPDEGQAPYANIELHDQIVVRELRNKRADRINEKAAENRKGKEEADGIDLKRTEPTQVEQDRPARDFAYVKIKSLSDLERAAQQQLDIDGRGETIELSAVPVGSLVNKLPGLGTIEQAAKIFGKKVKYFRVIGGTNFFDGAVIPGSDTIFINANAKYPALNIFGHELVHAMKNAHPKTYNRLKNALLPMLDEAGMIEFALKQKKDGVTNKDLILEEAIGDIVGDRFGESAFWRMLADENPSLFKQIADIAIDFINKAIAKLTGEYKNLGSKTLVKDLTAVRTEIASILNDLGDMVQAEQTQQTQPAQQTQAETAPVSLRRAGTERKETYYSPTEKVVGEIGQNKMNGEQWLNSIKGKKVGGVAAEMEWTGVEDWLTLNAKTSLTKQEVLDFVRGNKLRLNDIVLQGNSKYITDEELMEMYAQAEGIGPEDVEVGMTRQDFLDALNMTERMASGTKHGREKDGFVLPGGKFQAEIVLTDPSSRTMPYKEYDRIHFGDVSGGKAIGWIRMNERKDKDGNDVLFLEEIQSQRGQEGRDFGFGFEEGQVPPAPLTDDTRAWTALLIKRAIAYAQERGIDRIAWTRGEQQEERFKLSKRFDKMKITRNDDGTWAVEGERGDQKVINKERISDKDLGAAIGKELADKMIEQGGGEMVGTEMDVGNEGLRNYYDRTVSSVAKDVLKKFDGKVEVMEISGTGQHLGFVITPKLQEQVAGDGLPMFKRRAYEAQFDDIKDPKTVKAAMDKGFVSPPTIRERLEALRPNFWKRVVQATFDRFRAVRDIDLKAYMRLRVANGPQDGAVSVLLHYGQVFNDGGALNLKKGTKGLIDILTPVGAETDRFLLWIAANRAGQLKQQDRERFFTDDEIQRLKKLNLGTMKDGKSRAATYAATLQQMNELNRSVLDVARQSGLINEEGYKKFAADVWYIPFYRQMDDDGSLGAAQTSSASVGQYLSKKLKGSERGLNDLMENVLLNWSHILSASMKNEAAVETLKVAEQMKGVVTKLTVVDAKYGKDPAGNLVPLKYAVKVMDKGNEVYYQIEDELLMASLDAVASIPSYGFWTNTAREFKTTLTRFISLSPTFKINNLIRDSVQSIGLTELKKNPVANVIEGWRAYEGDRAQALAGGGLFAMGNAFDGDQASSVKRLVAKGVPASSVLNTQEKVEKFFKTYWDKYDEVSDAAENANRLALYNQLRASGASHLEAAYAARDLQDFSLQGSSTAVRYLSQILPYFNARLQGMYKLGRDGLDPVVQVLSGDATLDERQKAMRFSAVLGAVTLFGTMLYLAQKDDEEYKKLEDWERDAFFWIRIPGTTKAFRIPKPFEMGAFQTIVERFTEQIVDDSVEGKVFGKRLLAVLADNLAINPIPQIVRPLYDIARNKDGFTDRPIESMGMERLSKNERVNPGTSGAAVAIGAINNAFAQFAETVTGGAASAQNLQLSPIQYDYLLRNYLGWVGTGIQTASNVATAPFKPGESSRYERVDDFLVVGNYVKTLPQGSSKYVTGFYENAQASAMAVADVQHFINVGQLEKANELFMEKKDRIQINKLYTKAQDLMSDVTKQIKRIEDDVEMPGSEKRLEIERLQQLRIDYAKSVEDIRVSLKGK
jgi:Inorganic Pyrophosphatase/Large polyvalent protein associated domain 38